MNEASPLPLRVLVVDDQPMQRLVVRRALARLGHEVFEAASGEEALALVERHAIELVVSDWLMDGMDGTTLCRALRARAGYVYFILMSSRDSREDLIEGLAAGADDFLRKPVDVDELAVRLRSGQRLLALQAGLEDRNRRLAEAYGQIQRDVDAAGAFQKSLLPQESIDDRSTRFAWLFLPSRWVSGDALNCFRLDEHRIGFYHFDVAGHGVASAMVAMIVAQLLDPRFSAGLLGQGGSGGAGAACADSPAALVRALNAHLLKSGFGANYLTCVYGVLDRRSGEVRLVRAGHTLPLVVQPDGEVRVIDEDGDLPVGLFDDADFHDLELRLAPGARLCIYSDGVTECEDGQGEPYGLARLEAFLRRTAALPAQGVTRAFEDEIRRWAGGEAAGFQDDVSMLLIEHVQGSGPPPAGTPQR